MSKNNFYVYCWRNIANDKLYVGKGKGNRCYVHVKESRKKNPGSLIGKSIKKYGEENFELTLLEENLDEENAFQREIFYIDHLNSRNHGYNLTDGGDGLKNPSPQTRAKLSESIKKSMTLERRAQIAETARNRSPEHRAKLSEYARNRSSETRLKMSAAAKARHENARKKRRLEKQLSENPDDVNTYPYDEI